MAFVPNDGIHRDDHETDSVEHQVHGPPDVDSESEVGQNHSDEDHQRHDYDSQYRCLLPLR